VIIALKLSLEPLHSLYMLKLLIMGENLLSQIVCTDEKSLGKESGDATTLSSLKTEIITVGKTIWKKQLDNPQLKALIE
jgi:hypothetical protein